MNLLLADWTGLEQAGLYVSNAKCYDGGDWVVTELRPGERTGIKVVFACYRFRENATRPLPLQTYLYPFRDLWGALFAYRIQKYIRPLLLP